MNFIYNTLFGCTHTCDCVGMVFVKLASRCVMSASHFQSRLSTYIQGLDPRKSRELTDAVSIDVLIVFLGVILFFGSKQNYRADIATGVIIQG